MNEMCLDGLSESQKKAILKFAFENPLAYKRIENHFRKEGGVAELEFTIKEIDKELNSKYLDTEAIYWINNIKERIGKHLAELKGKVEA